MTEESKIISFYILALAGLIISSILFTGRIEAPPVEPLLPIPADPTAMPSPAQVAQEGCSPHSVRVIFYVPDLTTLEDNRLVISGTVYASDFVTPLPGALIEVWPGADDSPDRPEYPSYLFRNQILTDNAGQYEFSTLKPGRYGIAYFYYQVSYQDDCPVALKLFFVDDPAQGAAAFPQMKQGPYDSVPTSSLMLTKANLVQVEPVGPLLRGPVDIVLPVPPPGP
jgi:hypothetical protein